MDEAKARAERLRDMKERAQAAKRAREEGTAPAEDAPKLKFRNYTPKTEDFKEGHMENTKITVEEELKKKAEQVMAEVSLDVAPKKANWDLKRDVLKKLEKLERKTQASIVDLIRAKVAESGEQGEGAETGGKMLAAAVSRSA
mmetsp:Transcript_66596/g.158847  ORF Transcript_66596/g.158847 Transcript_66596/m.158847 type:complete len:143 (-) Transcript_66596:95-523(-)